jgi:hypothetical protein
MNASAKKIINSLNDTVEGEIEWLLNGMGRTANV